MLGGEVWGGRGGKKADPLAAWSLAWVHISKEQTVQPVRGTPSSGSTQTRGVGLLPQLIQKFVRLLLKLKRRGMETEREGEERKERESEGNARTHLGNASH